MASDEATDEQPLVVELTPGHPGGGEFTLRVTPTCEAELAESLQENDLYGGALIELAEPITILAVISVAVGTGGALTKLADVLTAFIKRHEGKEITLRSHTEELRAKGYSRRDVERIIDTTAKLQVQWDQRSLQQRAQWAADDEKRSEQAENSDDA